LLNFFNTGLAPHKAPHFYCAGSLVRTNWFRSETDRH